MTDIVTTQLKTASDSGDSLKSRRPLWRRIAARIRRHCQDVSGWFRSRIARPAASRSPLLSSVYYLCLSSAFRRDQQALLAGIEKYYKEARRPTEGFALLRRNTHRLEKGLLMMRRRRLFAVEYISETVDCYASVLQNTPPEERASSREIIWAHDVLNEYFRVTDSHPVVDAARERFARLADPSSARYESDSRIPYHRDLSMPPPVSIDAFGALARRRRSVRWFLDRPVPREMIDRAIEVAGQSPAACNRQPFVFRVLDDRKLVRAASVIPMGTEGYAHNVPVLVVVVGQQRHFFDDRDQHLIYIDGSLATMGFVYALEAQGLSSCCINWPVIEEREKRMAELLRLEPDERPIMCIAVGYADPDGLVAYSQKKRVDQLRRYNIE